MISATSIENANKVLTFPIAPELYEALMNQAKIANQSVEKFVIECLSNSIDAWIDYCNAISMLNNEKSISLR